MMKFMICEIQNLELCVRIVEESEKKTHDIDVWT
jgi:hypothetical protein